MTALLYSTVARGTELGTENGRLWLAHAAHQSMTVYLTDWERAYARLGRQIEVLRQARDERKEAKEAGTWPAPIDGSGATDA